jgi:transketolase
LLATGSEVSLALEAIPALSTEGWDVRVVSMPCRELFVSQSTDYKASVLPSSIATIAVEAGVRQGWTGFGVRGALGLDRFGASAPGEIVAEKLGLHVKGIVEQVLQNALH